MTAFHLELTPEELKLTHTALRSLLTDLSHDHGEMRGVVRGVLARMPPAEDIAAIDLSHMDVHRRTAAGQ